MLIIVHERSCEAKGGIQPNSLGNGERWKMEINAISKREFFRAGSILIVAVLASVLLFNVQYAEGKKKEDKVKDFLKFTVNLNVKWTIDNENSKNTGSMNIRAQGPLKLNREMSSMDQGLPAVMVNYKSQGNTLGFYSYQETIVDKDPPEDCPSQIVETYEGSGSTLLKIAPGPGNLITNHFASLFKDTGLGHMVPSDVSGMLIDHYVFALPFNEIEISGKKLNQSTCSWESSTRKLKIANSIVGKIEEKGKMEGRHTWTAKVQSAQSSPTISVKVNELPKTMNNTKPYSPEQAPDGNVTYTLSWRIEEFTPHVLIYRLKDNDWHDITDATPDEEEQEILPGEKLRLRAIVVMPGETGEPPKGKWEISSKDYILKDWEASESGSQKIPVTEFDKKEMEFFWWKETKSAKVKYVVKSKGLTGKTEFKLMMPKVTVKEDPGNEWAVGAKLSECEIFPYSKTAKASMKVTSTVGTKKKKPFCLQYIQLVKENNWKLEANYVQKSFFWHKMVHDFLLDTTYPYNGETCGASGSVKKEMKDTPNAQAFSRIASVYWDQKFQIFLMFRPGKPGANNAWVPLRRVDWGWSLQAVNVKNPFDPDVEECSKRFDLTNPANQLPKTKDGSYRAKEAEEYPKWTGKAPGGRMDLTEHEVENVDDSYKKSKPPK